MKFDKRLKEEMGTTVKANTYIFNQRLTFDVANIFSHTVLLSHLSCCVPSGSRASASITKPLERLNYCEFKKNIEHKHPLGHTNGRILRDLNMFRVDNYYSRTRKRRSYLEVFTWAGSSGSLWHGATIPDCWIAPRNTTAGTF